LRAERAWALVPVKPLALAKSRLAPALSPAERHALARELLSHVLSVLGGCGDLEGLAVISQDPEVAALARLHQAEVISEPPGLKLNDVVDAGIAALAERGVSRVLVLMSDLPFLAARDVERMIALGRQGPVVLAPDCQAEGTNALLIAPGAMRTCCGSADSFRLHRERAAAAGLAVAVYQAPSTARDVDSLEDLRRYRSELLSGARSQC
jgi:2-phospho-L-lactate/phosphoenolpyruvate guanylyltransferase